MNLFVLKFVTKLLSHTFLKPYIPQLFTDILTKYKIFSIKKDLSFIFILIVFLPTYFFSFYNVLKYLRKYAFYKYAHKI